MKGSDCGKVQQPLVQRDAAHSRTKVENEAHTFICGLAEFYSVSAQPEVYVLLFNILATFVKRSATAYIFLENLFFPCFHNMSKYLDE